MINEVLELLIYLKLKSAYPYFNWKGSRSMSLYIIEN